MPDLLGVLERWWKLIVGLSLLAAIVALITSLLIPKEYLSTVTALPANSATADKARIFNNNIEGLYSEFGSVDELDKIEGAAALDTIYIAAVQDLNLTSHYKFGGSEKSLINAVSRLKKNTDIRRSAYGELKIKVWDRDSKMAAAIANTLLEKLQQLYQNLQALNNRLILEKLTEDYQQQLKQKRSVSDTAGGLQTTSSSTSKFSASEQLQYQNIIDQYRIAVATNPPVLLVVEKARPTVSPDRPKILQIVLFTFAAAFIFSFLLSLILANRKRSS